MALVCRGVGQRYGPIPVRTIHIGTSGEPEEHQVYVEYNSVLCEPALHDAFLGNLITELRRDPDVDEIRLDGFVSAEVDKFMPANTLRHEKPSHYFDLADARTKTDDPITLLGRSIRYDLRRKLRDLSSIQTEWAADTTRAHEIVDEMIELHQTRWTAAGKPGAYASEYFRRFTREIVERLVPEGRSALVRVYDQDGVIGCNHLLFDRDRVLKFQGGTVSFDGSKRSPGLISDFMSIRESFERGYSAFDHLEGDTRAKRNLSTSVNQLVWAQVRQPSLRLRVVNSLKRFRSLSRNCRELCSAAPFLKKFKK